MEAIKMLFLLGAFGCLAFALAVFTFVMTFVGAYWLPLVSVACFCLFVVALALLVTEIERRRRDAGYRRSVKTVQTMQIKVEADTSQATAAIDDLQRRVENVTAMMVALERIAIHNVMGEVT
jgi:Flp pilus assembly protein TadB